MTPCGRIIIAFESESAHLIRIPAREPTRTYNNMPLNAGWVLVSRHNKRSTVERPLYPSDFPSGDSPTTMWASDSFEEVGRQGTGRLTEEKPRPSNIGEEMCCRGWEERSNLIGCVGTRCNTVPDHGCVLAETYQGCVGSRCELAYLLDASPFPWTRRDLFDI
jgi:hypothetical protein